MIDEKIRGIRLVKSPRVTVGVSLQEGMLDFSLESEDMSLAEMESILASLRRKKKFYRMKTGDFISLENNGLSLISDLSSGLQIPAGELEEFNSHILGKVQVICQFGTSGSVEREGACRCKVMASWEVVCLADRPEMKDRAARWFHEKWRIPLAAYLESMEESLTGQGAVPR